MSNEWSNSKHNLLINVLAVNSRGSMLTCSDDFYGIEKTWKTILDDLLKAIGDVGPSNVLQATGKEIERIYKHIFWSPCFFFAH